MAVYKEPKTNTWRVIYRYTDWNGERKQSQKRGFQTKREAQSWEREQLNKLGSDLDMTFRSFVEHYEEDRRSRIKDSTWESKEHIIRTKLLPYFGKLKMSSITPQQIVRWQNELINYRFITERCNDTKQTREIRYILNTDRTAVSSTVVSLQFVFSNT